MSLLSIRVQLSLLSATLSSAVLPVLILQCVINAVIICAHFGCRERVKMIRRVVVMMQSRVGVIRYLWNRLCCTSMCSWKNAAFMNGLLCRGNFCRSILFTVTAFVDCVFIYFTVLSFCIHAASHSVKWASCLCLQGFLYKKSGKPLSKEWKKKYATLMDDGHLVYYPSYNVSVVTCFVHWWVNWWVYYYM